MDSKWTRKLPPNVRTQSQCSASSFSLPIFGFISISFLGVELCITYNLSDAKDFVESYVAFSVNNLNGVEPTVNSLNEFERKELATNQINAKPSKTRSSSNKRNDYDPYDDMGMDIDDDGGDDLMGSYIGTTPKVSRHNVCLTIVIIIIIKFG